MKKIFHICLHTGNRLSALKDLPLLLMRLVLAWSFFNPAKMKWADINSIGEWFGSLGIPAPLLNAYLAASTEAAGVVLLVLGLGTRLIAVPLIITMLVAIKTVHWVNGFEAGENGYEIPLYYIIMLFTLFVSGAGKWSADYFIRKRVGTDRGQS
jgi:putative oxidoreductase